jgi:cell wall-associated NlpC family hydrolase
MGIDCSGLTQVVYKACGYAIPRDSSQQSLVGLNISLKSAQTGDLAVFSKPGKDKISHVGLVLKNDDLKVIHASGQVRIDRLTEEGIIRDDGICTHSLRGVRDIISD